MGETQRRRILERRDKATGRIEAAEARVVEIDKTFADPGFYDGTAPDVVRSLQEERDLLIREVEELMHEWEEAEAELSE